MALASSIDIPFDNLQLCYFTTKKIYTWCPMKNVIFLACAISMQPSRGGRAKRAKEEKESQLIHAEIVSS